MLAELESNSSFNPAYSSNPLLFLGYNCSDCFVSKENKSEGRSEVLLGPDNNIFKAFYEYLTEKLKYRDVTRLMLKLLA